MSRARPVTIGDINFERQGDALIFFKSMLARYQIGDDVSAEDEIHLRALLSRHIHYDEKVGSGLSGFCVTIAPEGSKCFAAARTDGSVVPFTYIRCVTGRW